MQKQTRKHQSKHAALRAALGKRFQHDQSDLDIAHKEGSAENVDWSRACCLYSIELYDIGIQRRHLLHQIIREQNTAAALNIEPN
jgi:lysozyme family protein